MTRVLSVLAALTVLAGFAPVIAQVPAPTQEQLELLRSMSPEDRQALLEQLGLGGTAVGNATAESSGDQSNRSRNPRDSELGGKGDRQSMNEFPLIDKTLKPDDTVLIDIDFKKDKPPRIETPVQGQPSITIPGEAAPVLEPDEKKELESLIGLVRSRNPYQLDTSGLLLLPGFAPIMLSGLNEEQATHRLASMNAFFNLDIKVTRLPVRKAGFSGLKPFGYDLFKDSTSTFAPVTDVPVPSDYIVGPGDKFAIQLFGSQNRTLRLAVGRDGRINFPEIGPVEVGGRSFESV